MENKNLFLAVILSVAFMFAWSTFVLPRYAPKQPPASAMAPVAAATASQGATITPAHAVPLSDLPESILRDEHNEIVFVPKGGGVRHWRLKVQNQDVDLVHAPGLEPVPLATFPDSLFTIRQRGSEVTMQTTLPSGVRLTKRLALSESDHLHNLSFVFENPGTQPVEIKGFEWGWGPGLGTKPSEEKENPGLIRALTKAPADARPLKPGDYTFGEWAAVDNRYFLVAFLPSSPENAKIASLHVEGTKEKTTLHVRQDLLVPARGQTTVSYQLYAGPKGYTQLQHYKKGLESSVYFGWFGVFGKPLLKFIYWLHGKTGNYGWAIVIMTVILQILLLPLTVRSFRATMKMKELQPQIAALQKAYKNDPKRLQVEMMNIYKKGGNPMGGCLLMLPQMPIFVALYNAIRNAYELQGAPFVGWIKDLSLADPYHVLPVAMGLGMLVQSRMQGAVSDPTQRQMMYVMPIVFTTMFWRFPAGLVLYWFTQSVMSMCIQFVMLRAHNSKKSALELIK